jgi:hypothetical protein
MRNTHMAIMLVISALLLMPSIAGAEITIDYIGETPVDSGEGNEGITGLSGGDNDLWDYVYDFTDSVGNMPRYWGIAVHSEADVSDIGTPNSNWIGYYAPDMNQPYPALPVGPGVVWATLVPGETSGTFSFRSSQGPAIYVWRAIGGTNTYHDSEWSASPEPASMALTGLALLGVGFWRRRKRTG